MGQTGVPHRVLCDTSIDGYNMASNKSLALHNGPTVWKDIDQIIPERNFLIKGSL